MSMRRAMERSRPMVWRTLRLAGFILAVACAVPRVASAQSSWSSAGGDIANSHAMLSLPSPTQITTSTAKSLALKWSFPTSGDVSATPTVEPGGLYVPDWGGTLYKLSPDSGALIWSHTVCDYTSTCHTSHPSVSRNSPAIGDDVIVIGDAMSHDDIAKNYGAVVIGVSKATGAKVWSTVVNRTSPTTNILGSPVIYNGIAYVGTASWEETVAGSVKGYQPVFRGNVTALNVATGAILWQFTTVPAGYSGGAVPGSNMVVWPRNHSLILGTGNNYSLPANVEQCVDDAGRNVAAQTACLDPTDYVDSLLSLDLTTGHINWSRRMSGADNYTVACNVGWSICPNGTDVDFAQAPLLSWVRNFSGVADDRGGTSQNYFLGAGQKNSVFYAVNPANGGLFWATVVGRGGMEWGSTVNADDENMVYFALNNKGRYGQTIIGKGGTNPRFWNAGAWGALNIQTGKVEWMVPTIGSDLVNPSVGALAPGCMTFTNRVVFAGSSSGVMVAMDASSGYVYWTFNSGGSVVSCPSIFNDTVYWGTGYARAGVGKHMLYAFAIP